MLNGAILTITDSIEMIGDRFYVKATVQITDGKESYSVSAFAREEEGKKGMDGAQVTGAASSYARKYALNGLFCIDDTADADTTNQHGKEEAKEQPKTEKLDYVVKLKNVYDAGVAKGRQAELDKFLEDLQVKNISTLSQLDAMDTYLKLKEKFKGGSNGTAK
jgi:hypothetical protein